MLFSNHNDNNNNNNDSDNGNNNYNDIPAWLKTGYDLEDEQNEQQNTTTPRTAALDDLPVVDTTNNTNNAPTTSTTTAATTTCGAGFRKALLRDWKLLLIGLIILICMNVPIVRWAFYPFVVFTTWIHECCHGIAALMMGYSVSKLEIFTDTSGLATVSYDPDNSNRHRLAFFISAGYQGTPVIGFLLLIFRRTKRGPRIGLWLLGLVMLITVAFWIRNLFGIVSVLVIAFFLLLCGWKLPSGWMRASYTVLSVTTVLAAISSCRALFGPTQTVNGEAIVSDAHAMAEIFNGTSSWMWATIWLFFGIIMAFLGVIFAIPGPNQTPDFACCKLCLDCGLFALCNGTRKKPNGEDDNDNDNKDEPTSSDLEISQISQTNNDTSSIDGFD